MDLVWIVAIMQIAAIAHQSRGGVRNTDEVDVSSLFERPAGLQHTQQSLGALVLAARYGQHDAALAAIGEKATHRHGQKATLVRLNQLFELIGVPAFEHDRRQAAALQHAGFRLRVAYERRYASQQIGRAIAGRYAIHHIHINARRPDGPTRSTRGHGRDAHAPRTL